MFRRSLAIVAGVVLLAVVTIGGIDEHARCIEGQDAVVVRIHQEGVIPRSVTDECGERIHSGWQVGKAHPQFVLCLLDTDHLSQNAPIIDAGSRSLRDLWSRQQAIRPGVLARWNQVSITASQR